MSRYNMNLIIFILMVFVFSTEAKSKEYAVEESELIAGSAKLLISSPSIGHLSMKFLGSKRTYTLFVFVDKKGIYERTQRLRDLESLGRISFDQKVREREKEILIPVGNTLYFNGIFVDGGALGGGGYECRTMIDFNPVAGQEYVLYTNYSRKGMNWGREQCFAEVITLDQFNSRKSIVTDVTDINGLTKIELSLLYGSPWVAQIAARTVSFQNDYEERYFEAMADRLWSNRLSGDKWEWEALGWIVKIIGESGSARYMDILLKVEKETKIATVKRNIRRAKKSLLRTDSPPYAPKKIREISGYTFEELEREALLINVEDENPGTPIFISKNLMYAEKKYDQEVLDMIAERLWYFATIKIDERARDVAWLCKAFGELKDPRYRNLVEKIGKMSSNELINKNVDLALQLIPENSENSFVPNKGW